MANEWRSATWFGFEMSASSTRQSAETRTRSQRVNGYQPGMARMKTVFDELDD